MGVTLFFGGGGDKNVLELDDGDSYTNKMIKNHSNAHLKRVNFIV